MKPVYQTKFDAVEGNCLAACVASILEVSLDVVPPLMNQEKNWNVVLRDWLEHFGLCTYIWNCDDTDWRPTGYSILCIRPNGCEHDHCVVAHDGIIVHDPWPLSGNVFEVGFAKRQDWTVFGIHDPSRMAMLSSFREK